MYDFNKPAARAGSDSHKWYNLPEDVIPMWVADMDVETPPEIIEAVIGRAQHPYYGYPWNQDSLKPIICDHYRRKYGVEVKSEWIVWVPSVIPGVVAALQMMGGKFMYSVPMYDHIRRLYEEAKLPVIEVPMKKDADFMHTMDFEALEAAVTTEVKSLILCNPHNPIGRVYGRDELEQLLEFCKKHELLVISDEIHCELDLENRHVPFFALNEDAAMRSVTLSSAGKICNIPGLPTGFAIIPDDRLRGMLMSRQEGLLLSGNVLTVAAYEKAYNGSCEVWKEELREHLRQNRDICEKRFNAIPELKAPHNEGTYLMWVDCSGLGVESPMQFFMEKAKVKVGDGVIYGDPQCIRFNYGCPRGQLIEAIDRMEKAINEFKGR